MKSIVAHAIYTVLMETCGASPTLREQFVQAQAHGPSEYRFGGDLSFGGKFWNANNRWYVNCYKEDETDHRLKSIDITNQHLVELKHIYDLQCVSGNPCHTVVACPCHNCRWFKDTFSERRLISVVNNGKSANITKAVLSIVRDGVWHASIRVKGNYTGVSAADKSVVFGPNDQMQTTVLFNLYYPLKLIVMPTYQDVVEVVAIGTHALAEEVGIEQWEHLVTPTK